MRGKYSHDHQRSTFLPKLCSSSSTHDQVELSHRRPRRFSSSLSEDEPSSPRVGCMGQIKRNNKINGFPTMIAYSTNNPITNFKDYHKLNKFFSTNSPTTTVAARGSGVGTHKAKNNNNNISSGVPPRWSLGNVECTQSLPLSYTDREVVFHKAKNGGGNININREIETRVDFRQGMRIFCKSTSGENNSDSDGKKGSLVNLEELDPPLPVVKQEVEGRKGESVSLWKRRSGGAPLKSLQVQVIHQSHALFPVDTL